MTNLAGSTLRRWEGQRKEAIAWNGVDDDVELNEDGADCFIYLDQSKFESKQHHFSIRFERLITEKCQPLIKKLIVSDNRSTIGRPRSSSGRLGGRGNVRPICYLCLPAPAEYKDSEKEQYHITTRNFFAWILNKSIVGPDPATALLALKIRMDLWRTSSTDNFSALYKYAKLQTYGELGDMQLYLTKRLKGEAIDIASYTMKSTEEAKPLKRSSRASSMLGTSLRYTMLKAHTHMPARMPAFAKPTFKRPRSSYETSSSTNDFLPDDFAMSGAVGPASNFNSTSSQPFIPLAPIDSSISLPPIERSRSSLSDMIFSPDNIPLDEEQYNPSEPHARRFSLPTLERDAVSTLYKELEQQEDWIKNLSKEHHNQRVWSDQGKPDPSTTGLISSAMVGDRPDIVQPPSSVQKHRHAKSLSRPPSPIVEEVTAPTPSQIEKGKMTTTSYNEGPAARTSSPTCQRAALPSHVLYCKVCAKPKESRSRLGHSSDTNISQVLRRHHYTGRNSQRTYSMDSASRGLTNMTHIGELKETSISPPLQVPTTKQIEEEVPNGSSNAVEERPSRFPSLRRANRASFPSSMADLKKEAFNASRRVKVIPWSEQRAFPGRNPRAQSMTLPEVNAPIVRPVIPSRVASYTWADIPRMAPLVTTQSHKADSQRTASLTQSQIHGDEPISAVISEFSAGQDSSQRSSGIALVSENSYSSGPSFQTETRQHRVPLKEPKMGIDSESVIDMILHEVDAYSVRAESKVQHKVNSRGPNKTDRQSVPNGTNIGLHAQDELRTQEGARLAMRESLRSSTSSIRSSRGLRHSLRLWNSAKARKDDMLADEYQGCVLIMDSSGKFSMVASPDGVMSEAYDSGPNGRSDTPFCELP